MADGDRHQYGYVKDYTYALIKSKEEIEAVVEVSTLKVGSCEANWINAVMS